MPKYDDEVKNVVCGDHKNVRRTITGLNPADPPAEAWLSVKETDDVNAAAVFSKHITTTRVAGQGQVLATDTNGNCDLSFEWIPADTRALVKGQKYYGDISFRTQGGIVNTPIKFTTTPIGDDTKAPEV